MKKALFFWISIALLGACSSKESIPADVLPPDRMAHITADVLVAREAYTQKKKYFDSLKVHPLLAVMKDYGIDTVKYYRSLEWYSKHPETFLQVYTLTDSLIKKRLDSLDRTVKVKRDEGNDNDENKDRQKDAGEKKKAVFPFGRISGN